MAATRRCPPSTTAASAAFASILSTKTGSRSPNGCPGLRRASSRVSGPASPRALGLAMRNSRVTIPASSTSRCRGFGQQGPYAKRPGSDSVAQAFSGLVSVNVGNDKTPHRVGTTISDVATGVYAFQAVATALFARATVGTGRWIDVSLTQSTAALLGHKLAEYVLEGGAPRALNVPAGSYQTTDGWLMVTLVNEPQYKRLCAAIGREDLASDPRFADFARRADLADALIPQMREVFLTQRARPGSHGCMRPISSPSASSRPATGCTMFTSRRPRPRSVRIHQASARCMRRARRASRAVPKTSSALRPISARTAARCSSTPASASARSRI